jgi:glycine/D-amino acid oxidase-like deaminating enzyme
MMLGFLLARAGVSVVVLEKHADTPGGAAGAAGPAKACSGRIYT